MPPLENGRASDVGATNDAQSDGPDDPDRTPPGAGGRRRARPRRGGARGANERLRNAKGRSAKSPRNRALDVAVAAFSAAMRPVTGGIQQALAHTKPRMRAEPRWLSSLSDLRESSCCAIVHFTPVNTGAHAKLYVRNGSLLVAAHFVKTERANEGIVQEITIEGKGSLREAIVLRPGDSLLYYELEPPHAAELLSAVRRDLGVRKPFGWLSRNCAGWIREVSDGFLVGGPFPFARSFNPGWHTYLELDFAHQLWMRS